VRYQQLWEAFRSFGNYAGVDELLAQPEYLALLNDLALIQDKVKITDFSLDGLPRGLGEQIDVRLAELKAIYTQAYQEQQILSQQIRQKQDQIQDIHQKVAQTQQQIQTLEAKIA
jgi:peptidoglycan hydrolase CwlO-like protein